MARKKSKPKPARVPDEEDIPKPKLRRVTQDEDENDSELTVPKPRSDVFTGLAALSLIALIGAAVFFYLDHEEMTKKSLAAPTLTVPAAATVSDAPPAKTN